MTITAAWMEMPVATKRKVGNLLALAVLAYLVQR